MGPVDFTPWSRNEIRGISDVKTTFSSWDSCMAKTYCKWPVIVGIIIGSLIVLGILWCIIGCLCCGYTCCKGCCSCCCPSGGGRGKSKYADPPAPPYKNYNTQYQPPPPPIAPPIYDPAPPRAYDGPKYAQFETHNGPRMHEDSLPAMPTWQNASSRRIEEDVEMNRLDPIPGRPGRGGYYEVPGSPRSSGYRGTEPTNPTYPAAQTVGVATTTAEEDPSPADRPGMFAKSSPPPPSRSPISSPPPVQPGYASYNAPHQPYGYPPSNPSSPPPPFSATYNDYGAQPHHTPSPYVGRRPVENSWKDV